jgi:hypothetical protein
LDPVAQVGKKNQVEIFLTALSKCVRAISLYSYGSGQQTLESVFENTVSVLERCLLDSDELELSIKPNEIVFERKSVYSNKDPKTSMSLALYGAGIRLLVFKRGFDREQLKSAITILATDFSKQEFMDDDLYCLFLEKNLPHMRVVGADLLQESMESDPGIKERLREFVSKATQKTGPVTTSSVRKLRAEDLKILEDFRLNTSQFSRPDSDVQKLIQTLNLGRDTVQSERQTLERLLFMGFHFLMNDRDGEQSKVGRDLVNRITLMSLQSGMFDLFEAVVTKLNSMQKSRPDKVGEYQKVLDAIYHVDHLNLFKGVLSGEAGEERLVRLLTIGPQSSVKLVIMMVGDHPMLARSLNEFILKNTPLYLNWILEMVSKNPQWPCWERLLAVLAQRPSSHYQKLLQLMLEGCGPAIRVKVLRFLAAIGGDETLKIFADILKAQVAEERLLVYELLPQVGHRSALTILKSHLDSSGFAEFPSEEQERAYATVIQMGGEHAFPYFLELWNLPGSGFFRKKSEVARRSLILRSLLSSHHTAAFKFVSLIDRNGLDPSLETLIQKLIKSGGGIQ